MARPGNIVGPALFDNRVVNRHWQASTHLPRAVFEPGSPQHAPLLYRPVWHAEHLVFQGGIPFLPPAPLNGGGFIPFRNPPRGKQSNFYQPYVTPVSSMVGGGSLPSRPNFLTRLLGGLVSSNQP